MPGLRPLPGRLLSRPLLNPAIALVKALRRGAAVVFAPPLRKREGEFLTKPRVWVLRRFGFFLGQWLPLPSLTCVSSVEESPPGSPRLIKQDGQSYATPSGVHLDKQMGCPPYTARALCSPETFFDFF